MSDEIINLTGDTSRETSRRETSRRETSRARTPARSQNSTAAGPSRRRRLNNGAGPSRRTPPARSRPRSRSRSRSANNSLFTNMIDLQRHSKRHGILLNTKWYDPVGLQRWVQRERTVPHSRRPLSDAEREDIARRAAEELVRRGGGVITNGNYASGGSSSGGYETALEDAYEDQGYGAYAGLPRLPRVRETARKAPYKGRVPGLASKGGTMGAAAARQNPEPMPRRPVFMRRATREGRYRYYKVFSSRVAHEFFPPGPWVPVPFSGVRPINETILVERPSAVDWSLDFNEATRYGHWESIRTPQRDRWHRPSAPNPTHTPHDWFQALAAILPQGFAYIWNNYAN